MPDATSSSAVPADRVSKIVINSSASAARLLIRDNLLSLCSGCKVKGIVSRLRSGDEALIPLAHHQYKYIFYVQPAKLEDTFEPPISFVSHHQAFKIKADILSMLLHGAEEAWDVAGVIGTCHMRSVSFSNG